MVFPILLALSGLTLSAVAIYYSVIGLTAVFAAAFWPVVVMGTTLEVSKLVAASWLKTYWTRIPTGMKVYMSTAVVVLMVITSMGIFGFLSKAHLDQNIVSGDVQSKIAIYDEKIATAKGNIDANRKALKQMDEAVDQVMGRSQDEKGADKAVALRRGQAKERSRLLSEIAAEQKTIAQLSEERAPIAAEVRKVEAEVGPIKYIAKLIYGDNQDANILEKAVTWVIMIIVFVFDPLAVLMLLGAQMTWQWKKEEQEANEHTPDPYVADVGEPPTKEELEEEPVEKTPWPFMSSFWPFPTYVGKKENEQTEEKVITDVDLDPDFLKQAEERVQDRIDDAKQEESIDSFGVEQWNKMIEEAEREAEKEKSAKQQWKAEHPDDTIKHQELLKDVGIIDKLPWEEVTSERKEEVASTYKIFPELEQDIRNRPDLTEVLEQEESKKKTYMTKDDQAHQVKRERK